MIYPTVPQGHKHKITTLTKSRGPPQSPAEPSKRPPQRPLRTPLRGKCPRRASRRVVPLGWIYNVTCGGVKQGRFVILCFPLFCSVWLFQDTQMLGKQHKECHCQTQVCLPQMLVKARIWEQCPHIWAGKTQEKWQIGPVLPKNMVTLRCTMQSPRITFHHFIFRALCLAFLTSWSSSKKSGQIILRNFGEFSSTQFSVNREIVL